MDNYHFAVMKQFLVGNTPTGGCPATIHVASTEISVMMNAGIQFKQTKKIKGSKVYYVTDTQSEQRNGSKSNRETTPLQKKVIFA